MLEYSESLENSEMIWVRFDKIVGIMQYGIKELSSVTAARYNGAMLIPNRKFCQPKLGARALVLKPKPDLKSIATYHENFRRVNIFAVNVHAENVCAVPTKIMIETETGKKIYMFENIFVPKNLLWFPDRDSIAKIVIRKPDKKHQHYFVLLKIEDGNIRKMFETFFRKNLANYQIRLLAKRKRVDENSDNLLRIIISKDERMEEVKKIITDPFHKYFHLTSGA